jgi:hypothetical protein
MRFLKVPIRYLEKPQNGLIFAYDNRFWEITEDDCLLFYNGSQPQCNSNESIVGRLKHPSHSICFIQNIYVPCNHDGEVDLSMYMGKEDVNEVEIEIPQKGD